jgi:hypothetical protein
MASVKKPLRFLDMAEMKIYSNLPVGKSRERHMSHVITACEAGHTFLTCPGDLGSDLELQDPCRLTWVPCHVSQRPSDLELQVFGVYLSMSDDLIDEPFLVITPPTS